MKAILLVCVLFTVAFATNCSYDWECADVSDNINFVTCENNVCQCRSDLGFAGNATLQNPCSCDGSVYWGNGNPYCKYCPSPKQIIYNNGFPYCIDLEQAELNDKIAQCTAKQKNERTEHYKSIIRQLYQAATPTEAIKIMKRERPIPDIFAEDFIGAVWPITRSTDAMGMIEYYFVFGSIGSNATIMIDGQPVLIVAYFTNPEIFGEAVNGTIFRFTSTVEFRMILGDINGNYTILPQILAVATQTGHVRFDCNGKIKRAIFDSSAFFKKLRDFGRTFPYNKTALAEQVCKVHEERCIGPLQGHASYAECVSYISSLDIGDGHDHTGNTTDCYRIHGPMADWDPDHHCPHIARYSTTCQRWTLADHMTPEIFYLGIMDREAGDPQSCAVEWYDCEKLIGQYVPRL